MGRYHLTDYDAAYIDLAIRRRLPLASFDCELMQAAAQVNIAMFRPSWLGPPQHSNALREAECEEVFTEQIS